MAKGCAVITSLERPEKVRELLERGYPSGGSKQKNLPPRISSFQDWLNPARFVFYEVWVSKRGHEQQFTKP